MGDLVGHGEASVDGVLPASLIGPGTIHVVGKEGEEEDSLGGGVVVLEVVPGPAIKDVVLLKLHLVDEMGLVALAVTGDEVGLFQNPQLSTTGTQSMTGAGDKMKNVASQPLADGEQLCLDSSIDRRSEIMSGPSMKKGVCFNCWCSNAWQNLRVTQGKPEWGALCFGCGGPELDAKKQPKPMNPQQDEILFNLYMARESHYARSCGCSTDIRCQYFQRLTSHIIKEHAEAIAGLYMNNMLQNYLSQPLPKIKDETMIKEEVVIKEEMVIKEEVAEAEPAINVIRVEEKDCLQCQLCDAKVGKGDLKTHLRVEHKEDIDDPSDYELKTYFRKPSRLVPNERRTSITQRSTVSKFLRGKESEKNDTKTQLRRNEEEEEEEEDDDKHTLLRMLAEAQRIQKKQATHHTEAILEIMDTYEVELPENVSPDACQPCGQPARGKHYGVKSCKPCSTFFKDRMFNRYAKAKEVSCTNKRGGKCPTIGQTWRSRCAYCRLQRCLEVGMTLEGRRAERGSQKTGKRTPKASDEKS